MLLLRHIAALTSAVAYVLAFAPYSHAWLAWFCWVPLLVAQVPGRTRLNIWLGWLTGIVTIGLGYSWISFTVVTFGGLPELAGHAIVVLFAAVFSWPYAVCFGLAPWLRRHLGSWWMLALPALWLLLENMPSLFPYKQGAVHYRSLVVWQSASVLGVAGLTFLGMASNAVLAEVILRYREGRRLPLPALGALAGSFVGVFAFGTWRLADVETELEQAPVLRVAQVQVADDIFTLMRKGPGARIVMLQELTKRTMPDKPDLVVWPEGALRTVLDSEVADRLFNGLSPKEFFTRYTGAGNFHLAASGLRWAPKPDGDILRTNSVWHLSRKGELLDRTDKRRVLLFGERRPFAESWPALADLFGPEAIDTDAGTRPVSVSDTTAQGAPYSYSVPICYEAILDDTMWDLYYGEGPEPVDLFVVVSLDAWFGDTASPHQHAALTAVHAIQLGRPMVRAATTGVSWIVEAQGRILGETRPFEEVARVVPLRLGTRQTLFVKGGWLFEPLAVLGGLFALGLALVRSRRSAAPGPRP